MRFHTRCVASGVLLALAGMVSCSDKPTERTQRPSGTTSASEPSDTGSRGGAVSALAKPGQGPSVIADASASLTPSCSSPPPPPQGDGFDVDVAIRAGRGPKGHATPVPINRRFYGTSISDWEPDDYAPTPQPVYASLLASLQPGVLRWPSGHRSQEYVWERGGPGQTGDWLLTASHVDAFMALAKQVGAEPLIAINVKRGTPDAAKDLLHYLNVEKGFGVKWLQIGNEPDLTDNMTAGPQVYADQVIRFVDALRSIDPTVRIVGPELLTGAHVNGAHDTIDWMTPVLSQVAGRIDGVSWHYYPLDSAQQDPRSSAIMSVEHLFQESAPDWRPSALAYVDEVMPALDAVRAKYAPNGEVWVTEIAEDPGPGAGAGLSDTLAGALWFADVLGRYGEYGAGAVLRWLFKGSYGYALLDPFDVPRPAYGAYWLYSRHFGDRFVDTTTSSITDVAAHASLRSDGSVSAVLVNKTTLPRRVRVTFDGFAPCAAEQLTLEGPGQLATTFDINGIALTESTARTGIPLANVDSEHMLDVELPPTSMRLVVYRP